MFFWEEGVTSVLGWMSRIDDDGVLGLVVDDKIGVVVTTAHPCVRMSDESGTLNRPETTYTWESIGCALCGE